MSVNPGDLWALAFVAILVIAEWRYRARRDGKREATHAMLFAALVLGVGLNLQKYFGMAGLTVLLIAIMTITAIVVVVRLRFHP